MIESLNPYPETKPSGLPWLGDIPEHWELRPLRGLIRRRSECDRTDLPLLTVARERGVFVRNVSDQSENHNVVPDDLSNYKVARSGDLVINKMKAWQGSMGIAPCDGIVSPAYFVFAFGIENADYGSALLRSKGYVAEFARISDGVRIGQWDLDMAALRQLPVVIPPGAEQQAISHFLNHANLEINRAIEAKRKTIGLLNEQKRAIIDQAVTRGLDPTVPLKPSGLPWLGDIPEHWEQRPLWTMSRERREKNPGDMPLLSVFLDRGVIPYGEGGGQVHAPSLDLSAYQLVRCGDLVLNNQQAWRGSVGVSTYTGIISPAYIVLDLDDRLSEQYAAFLFRSRPLVNQFLVASKGVGDIQRQVFKPFLRMVQIPVPPPDEQAQIADFVEAESRRIGYATSKLDRECELLAEYRTRLISDVVTGKLDVREAAKSLPEVDEESDDRGEPPSGEVEDNLEFAGTP